MIDMDEIRNLTDVSAMTRLLHEVIAQERTIDSELEHLLSQRTELEKKLINLQKSSGVLELVCADADSMLSSVKNTCHLADHVSGKVRELDLAQSRVQDTISRIEAIVNRSNCIDGVKSALEIEDFENAAKYVEIFLRLDQEYSAAVAGEGHVETAKDQKRQLLESKQKLEEVIRQRFTHAAENQDQPSVERFIKIFVPLGLQKEGLRSYVAYLRRVVSMRAKKEYETLSEALQSSSKSAAIDCAEVLTNIFRDVAMAVEGNEELLKFISGEEAIIYAIKELQEECDIRGVAISKRFMDYRKLPYLAKDVAASKASGISEAINLQELELCMEEMLLLTKRSEDYSSFMIVKIKASEANGITVNPALVSSITMGPLRRSIQEIGSYYVLFEEYFMAENVRKAIRIDEPVPDSLTTSMVDDVFYILQNGIRRAISSANVQPVLAVLNHVNNIFSNEYRECLQRKVREPNLATKLFSVAGVVQKSGSEIATSINNVDVSAEYVMKLRHEIEEFCSEVFTAPAEREKLKSCFNELGDISNSYKQMGGVALEQLANSITPRLRSIMDSVAVVNYELTEAQYAENEISDPWVQKLLAAVDSNVVWLQSLLTGNNYDGFIHLVIDFILKRLEAILTLKRFNQLGGLQLDRDVRNLVSHFSSMTVRTVRDKFARFSQIATILNLEKVSEILDYWGENSGSMTWRLTPAEVRKVLGLRVDFKPEVIASLRL